MNLLNLADDQAAYRRKMARASWIAVALYTATLLTLTGWLGFQAAMLGPEA